VLSQTTTPVWVFSTLALSFKKTRRLKRQMSRIIHHFNDKFVKYISYRFNLYEYIQRLKTTFFSAGFTATAVKVGSAARFVGFGI